MFLTVTTPFLSVFLSVFSLFAYLKLKILIMKKVKTIPVLVVILFFSVILIVCTGNRAKMEVAPHSRSGVAILITGAAARIPQEAALLEELDNRGLLKNLVFISGVSSGALNAVMLNGILSGKLTWNDYKNILSNLKNSDIYVENADRKLPLNTLPARELYKSIVEKRLGYFRIGDLPITTSISFTHLKDMDLKEIVYRMCSRKINEESDTSLGLVDIMMASSAFPLAFPPVRIHHVTTIPDYEYVDGGVGEDHVPFHALLEFEKARGIGVEKVFIISRKSDSIPEISEELRVLGINDKGVFDKLGISFDAILSKGIIKGMESYASQAPELAKLTYVWIPEFKSDFLLFNFENLNKQYALTSQWAKAHDPVPLSQYILPYLLKNK
jgi:predicted acylesterase/phospholipase RssA